MYLGTFDQKAGLQTCWLTLPKFIFCLIWIDRNQQIFKDKAHSPEQIASKTQALMGETLRASLLPKNKTDLFPEESNWLHSFNISNLDVSMARRLLEVWEIRMDHNTYQIISICSIIIIVMHHHHVVRANEMPLGSIKCCRGHSISIREI